MGTEAGMPLVTVVIPIYNSADKFINCLESICRQTYERLEILCIDDGSTKPITCEQETKIKQDGRVRLFRRRHKGPGAARNYGIKNASGDYILFVDSDDTILPEMIEVMAKEVYDNPEIDLVICGFELYQNDQLCDRKIIPRYTGDSTDFMGENFKRAYVNLLINAPWNKLIKRSLLTAKALYFDEEIKISEDLLFSLDVVYASKKLVVIDQALYRYNYFTPGSLITKYNDDMDSIILRVGNKICNCTKAYPHDHSFYCADIVNKMIAFMIRIKSNRELSIRERRKKIWGILTNKEFKTFVECARSDAAKLKLKITLIKGGMLVAGICSNQGKKDYG